MTKLPSARFKPTIVTKYILPLILGILLLALILTIGYVILFSTGII